ncbi:MAG TPA: HAMP domain-containing sensor histidine kinase, partial [Planctomycetota bacterium]|nr:HAMP domain-containing sensor histidine kinase [Planctomycetota bacterium]
EREALRQDAVVIEKLRQAQVAEFAHGDAAAAAAHFEELLGTMGPSPSLPVLVAAAWQAQRALANERVSELGARLDQALDAMPASATADRELARVVSATALFATAAGRPRGTWTDRLLPALAPDLGQPTLDRLAERGGDAASLHTELLRTAARRALLATVAEQLRVPGQAPGATTAGGRLLLWFPDEADPGSGRGALTSVELLTTLRGLGTRRPEVPGLPPVPERGTLVFARPEVEAEEVVPQLAWVTAPPLPEPPWFAQPTAVMAAGLALVAVFAASAFFTMRGLRREALAMRARAEFLTGVTHELKTPVAAIRLVADVLTDDDVPPDKQREYFGLLAGESARLSMLVENVLDLGQMERGERAYDLRPGDLAEVVREAVQLFTPLGKRAGLQLELHEGAARAVATLDRGALMQALLNVLENARKYAADGKRLEVRTASGEGAFTIAVRDYGDGVTAAERESIFTRFQRGASHRHGSIPGVGLGLYLARTIVQRHGGELHCVPPEQGPGAQFVFTLPLREEGVA